MNNRGQGVAYAWIYGLVSLFGLGVLYIVFNQVLWVYIEPLLEEILNITVTDVATRTTIIGQYNQYRLFFNAIPFILFAVVVIYMIVSAITHERIEIR